MFEQLKIEIPEFKEYQFDQWFYGDYIGYYSVKAETEDDAWDIFLKENPQYAEKTKVKGYFARIAK